MKKTIFILILILFVFIYCLESPVTNNEIKLKEINTEISYIIKKIASNHTMTVKEVNNSYNKILELKKMKEELENK